ncbi:hypothetical protein ACS0TY_004454 [Phlomoides rotata]
MKHNNVILNGYFRKHWQNYPARKTRQRIARQKKAIKIFPRPTAGPLRPIFHCQTLKYNMKVRAGKGFSLKELKAAGIAKNLPQLLVSLLIVVVINVQRLKTYKAKLVVFSRCACKVKAGDSSPEELATATQVMGPSLPIVHKKPTVELVKVSKDMKSFRTYDKLRL